MAAIVLANSVSCYLLMVNCRDTSYLHVLMVIVADAVFLSTLAKAHVFDTTYVLTYICLCRLHVGHTKEFRRNCVA